MPPKPLRKQESGYQKRLKKQKTKESNKKQFGTMDKYVITEPRDSFDNQDLIDDNVDGDNMNAHRIDDDNVDGDNMNVDGIYMNNVDDDTVNVDGVSHTDVDVGGGVHGGYVSIDNDDINLESTHNDHGTGETNTDNVNVDNPNANADHVNIFDPRNWDDLNSDMIKALVEGDDTNGQGLFDVTRDELKSLDLDIDDVRGHGYDNGSNMKGKHQGRHKFDKAINVAKEISIEMDIDPVFRQKRVIRRKRQFDENYVDEETTYSVEEAFKAHSYDTRPFFKSSAVKTQYRALWVPTVNRNNSPVNRKFSTGRRNFPTLNRKFPTASRKFTTGSTKIHTADMGRKRKAAFKVQYFLYIVDQALVSLRTRFEQYKEYERVFGFLFTSGKLNSLDDNTLKSHRSHLEAALKNNEQSDVDANDLFVELRVLLTIPVIVASAERSFLKLKLLKSYLRSTMSQERLNRLTLIAIKNRLLESVDYENLINNFASKNARRITLFKK
nr:zinc finger MYM-type protein 1 [Tanacetum cinerariifolium]